MITGNSIRLQTRSYRDQMEQIQGSGKTVKACPNAAVSIPGKVSVFHHPPLVGRVSTGAHLPLEPLKITALIVKQFLDDAEGHHRTLREKVPSDLPKHCKALLDIQTRVGEHNLFLFGDTE
jgi:hypothetical protein